MSATVIGATHEPCCSAHGLSMTCARYRRTHFVEVRPCCAVDAAAMKAESEARFEAAVMAGPNLDNVTDPDVIGAYGLEWDRCACGRNIPGDVEQCDECAPCPTCRGAGGWQQHDGLIVECPRGCMTGGAA
jgi:hypothetical protein